MNGSKKRKGGGGPPPYGYKSAPERKDCGPAANTQGAGHIIHINPLIQYNNFFFAFYFFAHFILFHGGPP